MYMHKNAFAMVSGFFVTINTYMSAKPNNYINVFKDYLSSNVI